MEITTVVLGAVLLAVLLFITLAPIYQHSATQRTPTRDSHAIIHDLRTRLDRILDSVRDLDFDYDTAKITDDVYAEQRKLLIGRGVSLLIQLDRATQASASVDEAIEAAVAARRTHADVDAAIEAAIVQRRKGVS